MAGVEYRINALRLPVAQGGAEAGEQLGAIERLGYIVIRTRVKRSDLIVFTVADAQDDDWGVSPFAESFEHLAPFEIGKAQVEQNGIRPTLGGLDESVVPGGSIKNAVAVGFERDAQEPTDLWFIINDESNLGDSGEFLWHYPGSTVGGLSG